MAVPTHLMFEWHTNTNASAENTTANNNVLNNEGITAGISLYQSQFRVNEAGAQKRIREPKHKASVAINNIFFYPQTLLPLHLMAFQMPFPLPYTTLKHFCHSQDTTT